MAADNTQYPTVGSENGKTVAGSSPDDGGEVVYDGPDTANELLRVAGVRDASLEERILEKLPEKADFYDDGTLRVKNNRRDEYYDTLNQNRRAILKRLDEGSEPLEVADDLNFNDSFVYRTRSTFEFLLSDDFLKSVFIESGGEYAPAFKPEEDEQEAEEEDEGDEEEGQVPLSQARQMAEEAYERGVEEGRSEASGTPEEADQDLFDSDEWWDIMKTLMENGEEAYSRRIASNIDLD